MEQHHPIMDKLGGIGGLTYRQTDRVGDCQARGSGRSVGGSGSGSAVCRRGFDCVLLGHILHVHRINGLVFHFPPDGGIWTSGKMVKSAAAA